MPIWCTGKIQFGDAEPGHRVGDAVAAEHRDLALGEEREAVGVHTGHALTRVEHTTGRGAARVAAGRDAEDVASADLDTERALRGLELGAGDRPRHRRSGAPPFAATRSRSTPRPTTPSAKVMIVLLRAPSLRTSDAGRPLYISPRTNMWHSASTCVMPSPWTCVPT